MNARINTNTQKFINEFEVNGINIYTNDQREFNEVKHYLNYFTYKIERIKKEVFPFLDKIKKYFEVVDNNQKYVLYTGQSLSDYFITPSKGPRGFHINDLDFFNLTFDTRSDGVPQIFDTIEVNDYEGLTSSSFGYRIFKSVKFNLQYKNDKNDKDNKDECFVFEIADCDRTINIINYQDYYSEFKFKDLDFRKRLRYSSLNTLNYFDLNNLQAGILINLETKEFEILYTKNFMDFIINEELEINPRRISPKTFERISNKFFNLRNKTPLKELLKNGRTGINEKETYYIDTNHLILMADLFNKMVDYIFNNLHENINNKTINQYTKIEKVLEYYNKIPFNIPINRDRSLGFKLINKYTKKLDEFYNKVLIETLNRKGEVKRLFADYINIDERYLKPFESKIELLLDIFSFERILNAEPRQILLIFNSIAHLAKLSEKKLRLLKDYCDKLNFPYLIDILIYITEEPSLLKRNFGDFKIFKYLDHSMEFLKLPLKNALDKNILLDKFILFDKTLNELVKENDKKYKRGDALFSISKDEIIGKMEDYPNDKNLNYFWLSIFDDKDPKELAIEIFNHQMNELVKEYQKLKKPFHNLKPIKIELNDILCEELINGAELKKEGSFMKHCVGGYVRACEDFESIIFRIRRKSKNPFDKDNFRYTFEYQPRKLKNKEMSFKLIQIRGKRNSSVLQEHSKIVDELVLLTKQELEKRIPVGMYKTIETPGFF